MRLAAPMFVTCDMPPSAEMDNDVEINASLAVGSGSGWLGRWVQSERELFFLPAEATLARALASLVDCEGGCAAAGRAESPRFGP